MSACLPPTTRNESHQPGGPLLTHPGLEEAEQQQVKQLLSWEEKRNSAVPVLPLPGGWGRRALSPRRPELLRLPGTGSHGAWCGRASVARQSCWDEQQPQENLKPRKAATAGFKRAEGGRGPLGHHKMSQPTGLPPLTVAAASVPRPSPYPGFQNSWYTLGINLQTPASSHPSLPFHFSAPNQLLGITRLRPHRALGSSQGPVKPRLPVQAWRGEGRCRRQTVSRQAEARCGQAQRGRRLAREQGDQGPLEAAVSQSSSKGQAGFPRRNLKETRPSVGAWFWLGQKLRVLQDPSGPGARPSLAGLTPTTAIRPGRSSSLRRNDPSDTARRRPSVLHEF